MTSNKKFFVLHLLPSRPDFAQTMTDEERAIMGQHVAYWTGKMNEGVAYAFGPVLDPEGTYGLGIVGLDSEEELASFIAADPAGVINRYEYFPMLAIVPEGVVK
jgi:uncharacterized protein YciI